VGTPFQRRVWQIVCAIPYGEVRTYQWIGLEMGRPEAMRAIGAAVGANPIPLIVPCHRVVQADGGIGGFSAPGGVAVKRAMLEFEGLTVIGEGQGTTILP
jgi:methylated-DNA-[protein]-cysteine S-methyltransferase